MKKMLILIIVFLTFFNCESKKSIPFYDLFQNYENVEIIKKSDYFYILLIEQDEQICYVNKTKNKKFSEIECYKMDKDVY